MKPATNMFSDCRNERQRIGYLHDIAIAHDADPVAHGNSLHLVPY